VVQGSVLLRRIRSYTCPWSECYKLTGYRTLERRITLHRGDFVSFRSLPTIARIDQFFTIEELKGDIRCLLLIIPTTTVGADTLISLTSEY
jgi:hypothetical protein